MRPRSIRYFEFISLGIIALGLVRGLWSWNQAIAGPSEGVKALYLPVLLVMNVALIALTLSISRGKSRIAMWINIILFGGGLLMWLTSLSFDQPWHSTALDLIENLGGTIALALLFTREARAWMST